MKLDAFISILRDVLLRYGNVDVYTKGKLKYTSLLTHEDIEVLESPNGIEVIISTHKD